MNWTPQQDAALLAVQRWLEDPDTQVFRLFGPAGTGKTSLAQEFDADLYAAYTGKAAYVLQQRGCKNATTIHRLIYLPRVKCAERLKKLEAQLQVLEAKQKQGHNDEELVRLRAEVARERDNYRKPSWTLNLDSPLRKARLLVVDEVSMVDQRIAEDLLSFDCKVLVLGDPYQLPPVYGEGYFTAATPDYMLTEVHRQARESAVLDFATTVREEQRLPAGHPCLVPRPSLAQLAAADQVIVGRNRTRHHYNGVLRAYAHMSDPLPMVGDKLVCTRNNHELGLLNGATYKVEGTTPIPDDDTIALMLDDGTVCTAHAAPFTGKDVPWWAEREAERFEYGYALTCHKAQGSQWDKVVVFDEGAAFRQDRWRWLYTAATRAAKELLVTA